MILSFIVPAYNAERTLGDCLDSLLNQDIPASEYEIIVVNDGSTDSTAEIIEQYSINTSVAIKHIHQKNMGASAARNKGIEISNADYVWFVDADDAISLNCLSLLISVINELNLDILHVGPSIPFISTFPKDFSLNKDVTQIFIGHEWLLKERNKCIAPWGYIINREILVVNNLYFNKDIIISEDKELLYRLFYFVNRAAGLSNFSVYNYKYVCWSLTHSNRSIEKAVGFSEIISSWTYFKNTVVKEAAIKSYYEIEIAKMYRLYLQYLYFLSRDKIITRGKVKQSVNIENKPSIEHIGKFYT